MGATLGTSLALSLHTQIRWASVQQPARPAAWPDTEGQASRRRGHLHRLARGGPAGLQVCVWPCCKPGGSHQPPPSPWGLSLGGPGCSPAHTSWAWHGPPGGRAAVAWRPEPAGGLTVGGVCRRRPEEAPARAHRPASVLNGLPRAPQRRGGERTAGPARSEPVRGRPPPQLQKEGGGCRGAGAGAAATPLGTVGRGLKALNGETHGADPKPRADVGPVTFQVDSGHCQQPCAAEGTAGHCTGLRQDLPPRRARGKAAEPSSSPPAARASRPRSASTRDSGRRSEWSTSLSACRRVNRVTRYTEGGCW